MIDIIPFALITILDSLQKVKFRYYKVQAL